MGCVDVIKMTHQFVQDDPCPQGMMGSGQGDKKGGSEEQYLKNQVERVKSGSKCSRYRLENQEFPLQINLICKDKNTLTRHLQCWKGDINLVCNEDQEKCECRHRTSWVAR